MDRRAFLSGMAAAGCGTAGLFTPRLTLASAPGQARLVVLILRGAMDGLDVVQPLGDPAYRALRPRLAAPQGVIDLDGHFALHPALADLMPLWRAGELGFVHATSTPYRDRRSHFDGQDLLEAGLPGQDATGLRDGWVNRLVASLPGAAPQTVYTVGVERMLLTAGAAPVSSWAPEQRLQLTGQQRRLLEAIYHDDPLFRDSAAAAMDLAAEGAGLAAVAAPAGADMAGGMAGMAPQGQPEPAPAIARLAAFAARQLLQDTRIAAFSLTGWDTHVNQQANLPRALAQLQTAILTLRQDLGPAWAQTCVLAMTEFGRTAAENGAGGTDHGTAGLMLAAGGRVRGGRVYGPWPGLEEADLHDRRDLRPTTDLRAWAGWTVRALYGLDRATVEGQVFPGLDLGADPGLVA